jgi:hypothetical protein
MGEPGGRPLEDQVGRLPIGVIMNVMQQPRELCVRLLFAEFVEWDLLGRDLAWVVDLHFLAALAVTIY